MHDQTNTIDNNRETTITNGHEKLTVSTGDMTTTVSKGNQATEVSLGDLSIESLPRCSCVGAASHRCARLHQIISFQPLPESST